MSSLDQLRGKHIHFVGIGGAGMSGIARIMLSAGLQVSGSDAKESAITQALSVMGAKIFVGHDAAHLSGVDTVIYSGAISFANPELSRARDLAIPILTRAQALALLMDGKRSVAVAGTHGKTTTTSMLTVALQQAGADPSFAIGGLINSSGVNAHLGSGDIFVAEADESDGSFIAYKPYGAIVTNLELDHVDHFATLEDVYSIFLEFVGTIRSGGFLVLCIDDPGVKELRKRISRNDISIITYGLSESDYQISRMTLEPSGSFARISKNGALLPELVLNVPGEHNVLNATAALAAALALNIHVSEVLDGLKGFTGSRRRFERKGEVNGIEVVDDYGHHPTEITVTLKTARKYTQDGRTIVIFQPHRYSRTQAFAPEFAAALELADLAYVLDIYAASEAPIPGVTSQLITNASKTGTVHYVPSMLGSLEKVVEVAAPGDLIITLGAGDVNSLAPVILQSLEERYEKN